MGENKRIGGRKSNRVGTESREQKDKAMHICPKMGQKPKAQAWAEQNSEQYTPTLTNTIQRTDKIIIIIKKEKKTELKIGIRYGNRRQQVRDGEEKEGLQVKGKERKKGKVE